MPESSNNSFIPKSGPTKRSSKTQTRRVYLFTVVVYIFLFATLLSSAAVYLYATYVVDKAFADEVALLNEEIKSFSEAKMQSVIEFDGRLRQANGVIANSASVLSVLDILEDLTIDTVQIGSLSINRTDNTSYNLVLSINTDSYDSVIFQRDILESNKKLFDAMELGPVAAVSPAVNKEDRSAEGATVKGDKLFTFDVKLEVPLQVVPPKFNTVKSSGTSFQVADTEVLLNDSVSELVASSSALTTDESTNINQ